MDGIYMIPKQKEPIVHRCNIQYEHFSSDLQIVIDLDSMTRYKRERIGSSEDWSDWEVLDEPNGI